LTAEGVINSTIEPKWTKSIDMHFEWLKERQKNSFIFIGGPEKLTWRTILQSIIRQRIIGLCGQSF
jgi:hypothetical protein